MKRCTGCGVEKPLDEFGRRGRRGFKRARCRACHVAAVREWKRRVGYKYQDRGVPETVWREVLCATR